MVDKRLMKANTTEKNRKIVMLTVTEACNLDCVYCYEKHKSNAEMNIETAKAVVKYEFENSEGFDEIEFDLFGGEPTIRKDFIKVLVEWACLNKFNKPFLFYLQTNGTLIDKEFQEFLGKYEKHVCVGLSLDGTRETHNKNRSNSYDKIDIDFFLRNYPEQGVRITLHPQTINNLFNDIVYLHNLGFNTVDATFAHGIDWQESVGAEIIEEQLRLLCDYYLAHPELQKCSIFDMHIAGILNNANKSMKMCGTGTAMVSVDVNGKKYPCQTFQPNTTMEPVELGSIDFEKIKDFSDKECSDCQLEAICPNCYGMNYLINKDILKRNKLYCVITRLRAKAVAYLSAKEIENGTDRMSLPVKYKTITAIQKLQNTLM